MQTQAQTPPPPLARHALFSSRDLDEARERVASVFCPHKLDIIGRGQLDARHHHLMGESLSLNFIEYGAKTLISPGRLRDFYLFQLPLAGSAAIRNGADSYVSTGRRAALLNPHLPTTMIWEAGCRQLLVQIERRALSRHLARLIGDGVERPLTFTGAMAMDSPAGASLAALLRHLVAEADAGRPMLGAGSHLGRQIEAALMTGLLEAHCHNYSSLMGRAGQAAPAPRLVRRAEEYMLAHIEQSLTLDDVAAAAGVSARGLQYAFRRFRDTTPMGFLRNARLARAHAELQSAAPGTTVTDVAIRWGFMHFGRFAECYRKRYGCTPRQTLQQALRNEFTG